MDPRTLALAEALFAVVVWGASFIATKIALTELTPPTLVWMRFAIGVVVIAVAAFVRGELIRPSRRDLAVFGVLGFIGITFHPWLQSQGLITARASTSGFIIASTPVFIALLARVVLRERLGGTAIAGIAVAAAGVLLVATRGRLASLLGGHLATPGDWLIVLSAPNWAIFSVLSRRALAGRPPAGSMLWVMGLGLVLATPLLLSVHPLTEVAHLSLRSWESVAFLGLACSGLAFVGWYDALRQLPASRVGALLYLEPLIALVVAAVVLGEPVSAETLGGGAAILLGVWLVSRRPAERPESETEAPASTSLPGEQGKAGKESASGFRARRSR